jgi:hypothetical protein
MRGATARNLFNRLANQEDSVMPCRLPLRSRDSEYPVMRRARQITLVLQERDGETPAELDIPTMQRLLAQEPVVSKTETAGRMLIYTLDRRTEANENGETLSRWAGKDRIKK